MEIINVPGGEPIQAKAIDLQRPDTGFNWVRGLSPVRQNDLVDLGAGLFETVGHGKLKTERAFTGLLRKKEMLDITAKKLQGITSAPVTIYDVYWCYAYAVHSKMVAEEPDVEFERLDELTAERMGTTLDRVRIRRARLDFCEMIAKFQEAQMENSRGTLMLRKWYDALRGDNVSAKFFLAPKREAEEFTLTVDLSKLSEAELKEQIARKRKKIGANLALPSAKEEREESGE